MNISATSVLSLYYMCASSTKSLIIVTTSSVLYLLLLPLILLVLYISFTKRRNQRQSALVSISHFDVITSHMMAQEVLSIIAMALYMFGLYRRHYVAASSGTALYGLTTGAQAWLHLLTCMERYLAVVHPVTYLRSKTRGGVAVRNASIAAVWLLSVVYMVVFVTASGFLLPIIVHSLWVAVVLATVVFCSVSILCVLIRPGPGERGGNRKRTDQSKLSAFITVTIILGVLLVRLMQLVVLAFWFIIPVEPCVLATSTFCSGFPSSLVLPLLFLHRDGKLSACHQTR